MITISRFGRLLLAMVLLAAALLVVAASPDVVYAGASCGRTYTLDKTERLQFGDLDNASGMVASRAMDGVFWAVNDGLDTGNAPNTVFAIDAEGRRLATINFQLSGVNPTVPGAFVDLEDLAMGPGPVLNADYLHIADIGDNFDGPPGRSEVAVYRFREPTFDPDPMKPKTLNVSESAMQATRFTYQRFTDPTKTQARNAEAIIVDPQNGDLYIFEKGRHTLTDLGYPERDQGQGPVFSNVYRVNKPQLFFGDALRTARIVSYVRHAYMEPSDTRITGADISPDGTVIVVRNAKEAYYWYRGRNKGIPAVFDNDPEAPCFGPDGTRGESVAILPDGSAFYGLREGSTQPLSPVFKAEIVGFAGIECEGKTATRVGTNGDDIINGTSGNDVIVALAGNDVINGNGGADIICAGSGNDTVYGGAGHDVIYGGWGKDDLNGGFGTDRIFGGINADTINGDLGTDFLYGGENPDVLRGGSGNDFLRGDRGNDTLWGGADNDTLKGNGGNDALSAGSGTDSCDGGYGTDTTSGCETQLNIP